MGGSMMEASGLWLNLRWIRNRDATDFYAGGAYTGPIPKGGVQ